MTTFKAVDGWTFPFDIKEISEGQDGIVDGRLHQRGVEDMKCTIIPGHWASRIEANMITDKNERHNMVSWHFNRGCDPDTYWNALADLYDELEETITRKLRGEA